MLSIPYFTCGYASAYPAYPAAPPMMDTSHGRKEAVWRRKLYKVLHQAKDADEDQRPIGMTTPWSGLG